MDRRTYPLNLTAPRWCRRNPNETIMEDIGHGLNEFDDDLMIA
jgi:hypothetical protein